MWAESRRLVVAACISGACAASTGAAVAAPNVVASIAPVHALVAGVMAGVAEPALIVRGYGSPHTYQMRPSDSVTLQNAELVFWMGPDLETFLQQPLDSLTGRARVVELAAIEGLDLAPGRGHDDWARHESASTPERAGPDRRAAEHAGRHPAGSYDMHVWLDVDNAKRMVDAIARELMAHDPPRAERYRRNRDRLVVRLDDLDEALRRELEPVRDLPYVVFHDAFQYLERRYRLHAIGSLLPVPGRMPSAKRVRELRRRIVALGVRCVFREPQTESALIATLVEGTGVEVGVLDPLGAGLAPGPDAYFEMMRANASTLARCLGG